MQTTQLDENSVSFVKTLSNMNHFCISCATTPTKIEEKKGEIELQLTRSQITQIEDLYSDPLLAQAEKVYTVDSQDSNLNKFVLSKKVVEDIFWSKDEIKQEAAKLIIKALEKGRYATQRSGLVPFKYENSVFKALITGRSVGAIRAVGYFRETTFYFVTWSEGNHEDLDSQKLVQQVMEARRIRFPSYR